MTMTRYTSTKQQFLVTWYHPVEFTMAPDDRSWVIGRNDDFGYEITRALVEGDSEFEALDVIRSRYQDGPANLIFRSCTPHRALDAILRINPEPFRIYRTGNSRRQPVTA